MGLEDQGGWPSEGSLKKNYFMPERVYMLFVAVGLVITHVMFFGGKASYVKIQRDRKSDFLLLVSLLTVKICRNTNPLGKCSNPFGYIVLKPLS